MREKRKKVGLFIILLIAFSFIFQTSFLNLKDNSIIEKNLGKIDHSGEVTHTRQWIINGNFSSPDNWTSTKGPYGHPEDVDAAISGGTANYTINGESGIYSISGVPNSTWTAFDNPDWGVGMDEGTERGISDNYGCWVSYTWNEGDDQTGGTPSVHWKRNITLPVNMSDYKITSASLNVTFNATVTAEDPGGIDVFDDNSPLQVGDYARFYVLISDIENVYQPFQVANNRTKYLGDDGPPPIDIIDNTSLTNIDEALLINYLELILGVNSTTFTMTLGIDLFCEDNNPTFDEDTWDKLRINFFNLTFTYEKKIDTQTSVSWNQQGDKPSDVISNPFVIDEAILNFKYKTNDTWPKTSSPNSEVRIWINEFQHTETIKLEKAKTTFQNASTNGFDVTRLIDKDKDINVSIEVYLADDFELNRTITFSIDDVYLNITYTEEITDIETKLQLFLNGEDKTNDPVIALPLDEPLNITVKYTNETGDHIPGALVQLEGKVTDNLTKDPTFDQYSIIINTNQLGIGVKILAIIAQKSLYETNKTQFFVEVTERETELLLYLDRDQKNDGDTINVKVDTPVNITVSFRDNETKQRLPNATVVLLGWDQLNETNNHFYNITINTKDLDLGINAFTIFAQLVNYTTNSINFFISVYERETKYQLLLNNVDLTLNPFINITIIETLNITVKYLDNETENHITNATLDYIEIGGGLTGSLTEYETLEFYSEEINATDLGIGVSIINIIAQKTLYQTQNIQFSVEITERETEILLYIEGDQKNDGDTIQAEIDDLINITLYYKDNVTKEHLPNATVELLNWGMLNETNNQYYNITIDAKDLEQGITIFTIFAQKENYQPQIIRFFIEVTERETKLQLFLNGELRNDSDTIIVEVDEIINITVYYRDNKTGDHLINATVDLLNWDSLNETNNQYTIIINANDLDQGITVLTVFAQKDNYQPQSINFFVEVIVKVTILQLYLNGEDKTLDPVFNLTIGELLNITIKYTEQSGAYIPEATIQLIGEGILINLTRDDVFKQYYIELNTLNLKVGVNLFSIISRATNYEIQTIKTIITINRINTLINTTSQINVEPGDDVMLIVILNDLDFGGTVINATVTYAWAYGQGKLVDIYNNGTYQIVLENVPEGTYTITITAFAGDEYDFESKEITLIVTSPEVRPGPDLSWLIYVLVGGIVGLVTVFTLYQTHYKYPPMVRKIRKLRKKIRKEKKIKPILIGKREDIIKREFQNQINAIEIEPKQVEDKIFKVENNQNLDKGEL